LKNQPQIIDHDEDLIFVNKPANYLSIPDRFQTHLPNVQGFLKEKFEQVFTVHRIDKETSGIMLFAKNETAHKAISQQFENRTIQKYYLAIANGRMHADTGVIDKAIGKHPGISGKMIISSKGKPSISEYKVLERFKNFTSLEVNIKTGRTHQIRVHLDALGHPLAVDPLYARKASFFLSQIKGKKYRRNANREERPLISRCTLHAHRLELLHPRSEKPLSYSVDPPKDFSAMLKQLRKWDIA